MSRRRKANPRREDETRVFRETKTSEASGRASVEGGDAGERRFEGLLPPVAAHDEPAGAAKSEPGDDTTAGTADAPDAIGSRAGIGAEEPTDASAADSASVTADANNQLEPDGSAVRTGADSTHTNDGTTTTAAETDATAAGTETATADDTGGTAEAFDRSAVGSAAGTAGRTRAAAADAIDRSAVGSAAGTADRTGIGAPAAADERAAGNADRTRIGAADAADELAAGTADRTRIGEAAATDKRAAGTEPAAPRGIAPETSDADGTESPSAGTPSETSDASDGIDADGTTSGPAAGAGAEIPDGTPGATLDQSGDGTADGSGDGPGARDGDQEGSPHGAERPHVLRWSRSPAAILVGVLIGLLGFGIAVQVRSNTSTSGLPAARQEDLVRILDDLSSREDRLRRQIADLEAARSRLSTTGDKSSTALEEARKRSDALGILAGTLAAQGPGIVLTITDPDHRMAAEDLLDTVEELRAAGAEAIQIGGVRIGLDSSFTATDNGIAVDGVVVTVPYTILAIGDPPTLATAMGIPGGVSDTAKRAGGQAGIEQREQVVIRAVRPIKTPRYSQPTN